ncbi:11505_t:CDS:2 [Dentiscutata heterogama]|uniref:11505_t:CDS:1 n=1 Tax=Dentiscutata heterogama TaxID=1316150 RepID=A0ACA9KAA7_9GLOM|nr:11505_t:CDS:2 [Dentiscutata heterogama]
MLTTTGLQRHESLKHYNYKEIPEHILSVPEYELRHIKNAIVKEYSVCGGWYQCFFDGEEAIDQLTKIFRDNQWAERNYRNGQLLWIKLYENELNKIKEMNKAASKSKFKSKKIFHLEKGLLIEWRIKGFSDKAKHHCESGEVKFRFVVDQGQF